MTKSKLQNLWLPLVVLSFFCGCASGGAMDEVAAGVMPAAEAATGADRDEVGGNGLLTPAAILARFADAVGGEEAMRSHTSSTVRGTFSIPSMGMEGELVQYAAAPDKIVVIIEMAGMGTINQGYNGTIGWSDNPMTGAALLEGDLLAQIKEQSAFYGPLDFDELFPTQETVELAEFNGEDTYKLRLVNESGRETFFFFSEASGLLVGMNGIQSSEMGEAEVTTRIGDYRDFGGVLAATTNKAEMMGMEIVQTITELTWDDVADDAFEPPDSIKALLE